MARKVIQRKIRVISDDEFYENDPLFKLLSLVKSEEELEMFKQRDREIREKERIRNARYKKY